MSKHFTFNPKLDFAIERFIDAPTRFDWEALTKPEHLKEWYMPRPWGRVARAEMDVRPGGIISIDIAIHRHRRRSVRAARARDEVDLGDSRFRSFRKPGLGRAGHCERSSSACTEL